MFGLHEGVSLNRPTLYIASDHAGFELKQSLLKKTLPAGYAWSDLGPKSADRVDYPDFAKDLSNRLLQSRRTAKTGEPADFGILICGSGQGMAMTANRLRGIRAAIAWNQDSARLSREHNDANILCLGARLLEHDLKRDPNFAFQLIDVFLRTAFEGGRHVDRVHKIEPT